MSKRHRISDPQYWSEVTIVLYVIKKTAVNALLLLQWLGFSDSLRYLVSLSVPCCSEHLNFLCH
jgi:hypothetical protein